jgi:hypothetical protein
LFIDKSATVTANSTVAVNTLDWDGAVLGTLHTINDGVTFTINSPVLSDPMDDPITLRGSGAVLAVNFSSPWEMRSTLTTNPANVGTATLGGTSRMILTSATGRFNANGNTTVSAPITFDADSTTTVAAGARLTVNGDAIHNGGTITGAGYYWPSSTNTVTANSTISTTDFNFDSGNWTVQPGARLTVNVGDYDPDVATNSFGNILTLNSGNISVNTADPVFVMALRLNLNNTTGTIPYWTGEPIQIGNDAGTLDADLNVGGTGISQIGSAIDFKSDADLDIAAGATLQLLGNASFNSVNGAINAEFTGGGRLQTNGEVYFNEATTFNMTGGSIDLDGSDAIGSTIFVNAPVTINVTTLDSFGKLNSGGGSNVIEVNGWTGTGKLTVNLDSPTAEWTLDKPGVLVLKNEPAAAVATLLAGSDANLNGYVQITGDVRSDARVDIGGTIDIQTAGKPFRLSGGGLADTNVLTGGTINGPGILGADASKSLTGYGTIHANIDFDGVSDVLADNGTLTVNGAILDADYVGTNDSDGILDVANAWDSAVVGTVRMRGGELRGGTLTVNNTNGISGLGLVSALVINNTKIEATVADGTLVMENASNSNDWDGTHGSGTLRANLGTLEIRDNAGFLFSGTVSVINGGTVFANGFPLILQSSSTLSLASGTFKQSAGLDNFVYGTVTIGAGTSTLRTEGASGGFRFSGSAATLTGNLQLDNPLTQVTGTATFSGAGRLINLLGRQLSPDHNADLGVLVENRGTLSPGATGIARNDMLDYVQTAAGSLAINLNGTGIGNFDRLIVDGNAQLAGTLQLVLGGGYVPALNDTLTIVSATAGVTGTFSPLVQPSGMPADLTFEVIYTPPPSNSRWSPAARSTPGSIPSASPTPRTGRRPPIPTATN